MTSAADVAVARLKAAGVGCLFGVPGGGTNLDLVAAAGRHGVRFVLTATETAAAIAASAQAEITGRPGACVTTLGPGVASAVNGIACAHLERAPLIVFTDAAPADPRFVHQRLDHRALVAPVTKWSATITARNADTVMERAIDCAMSHPRGPVHVECAWDAPDPAGPPGVPDSPDLPAPPGLLELSTAVRPLVLVGLGARDDGTAAAVGHLCASQRIPALVTYKAKGVVADTAEWFAGIFTNGVLERPIVEQADALIAIGLDPVELLPRSWTYTQPVVHATADDLASLAATLGPTSWDLTAVRRWWIEQRRKVCVAVDGLAPHRIVEIAAACVPGARATVDAGAHMFPVTVLWPVAEPNGMLISNGLSTMGFALPAAIGAALLDHGAAHDNPGRGPVIAFTGDGGLLMCAGELVTAVRERLDLVVVVFNDGALSLIDIKQRQRALDKAGVDIGAVDWRAVAGSLGMTAYAAYTEDELAAALNAAASSRGPALVDVRTDPSGYPAILRAVRG